MCIMHTQLNPLMASSYIDKGTCSFALSFFHFRRNDNDDKIKFSLRLLSHNFHSNIESWLDPLAFFVASKRESSWLNLVAHGFHCPPLDLLVSHQIESKLRHDKFEFHGDFPAACEEFFSHPLAFRPLKGLLSIFFHLREKHAMPRRGRTQGHKKQPWALVDFYWQHLNSWVNESERKNNTRHIHTCPGGAWLHAPAFPEWLLLLALILNIQWPPLGISINGTPPARVTVTHSEFDMSTC